MTYQRRWERSVWLLLAVGVGFSSLLWTPVITIVTMLVVCAPAGALLAVVQALRTSPPDEMPLRQVPRRALLLGSGVVTLVMVAGVSPAAALCLGLVAAATSPPVVRLVPGRSSLPEEGRDMDSSWLSERRWSRHPASWVLHALDALASRPSVAVTVVALDLLWVVFSARFEFPTRLESVFQTMVAAVTLAMVFVIQHTQARQQAVTQRKLDEILRSLPEADRSLITLETAPDHELREATRRHQDVRHEA